MKLWSKTSSFLFAALMGVSSSATAQDPPPDPMQPPPSTPPPVVSGGTGMGSQGQIVLGADMPFLTTAPIVSIVRSSVSMGGGSSTDIVIAPSADYFIAPSVSVGALLGFATGSAGGTDTTTFGLMPRAGFHASLTNVISVWPRAAIGYFHTSVSAGGGSASGYTIPALVEAPVLWHPAQHFFIGAGPMVSFELVNKGEVGGTSQDLPKTTRFGINTMIGGYFDL